MESCIRFGQRRTGVGGEQISDDVQTLPDVIEDDHVIEKEQARVRNANVLGMGVGNPLRPSCDAITEEADSAAKERRKFFLIVDTQRPQLLIQQADRIGCAPIEAKAAPRIESDERITAE